jgi:Domain of Unknown Function with PDB structure (DUF3857)/Transglutaminase-like superfamily
MISRTDYARKSPPARMLLWIAAFLCANAFARGSQPPAWLAPLIGAPAPAAKLDGPVVVLLEDGTMRYEAGGKVRETIRQVVRVMTTNGSGLAQIGRNYNADTDRILKAQAWVVSPDGKQTDAFGRGDFISLVAQRDNNYWNSERVIGFSPPSHVAVGGMVAAELEIERDTGMRDTSWSFFQPRPVVRSRFEVIPLTGGQLVYHASSPQIPAPMRGQSPGSLVWEMNDLATMPRNMPPGFIADPRQVKVRCAGSDALTHELETWGGLAGVAAGIVEPRMINAPAVTERAKVLVRGKEERWEKIRAVADWVQKQVTYLSLTLDKDSVAGMRPHLPEEVLRDQLGDCKDKSTLMVTMLRLLGEKAYAVLVFANNPNAIAPEWPAQVFNHMVVGIAADEKVPSRWPTIEAGALGRLVVFDPTNSGTPLGVLPLSDQGVLGLVVAEGHQLLVKLPAEDPAATGFTRHVTGEVTAAGDVSASVEDLIVGTRAANVHAERFQLGDTAYRQRLEERLHGTLPLLSELNWKEEWTPVESRSQLTVRFVAPRAMRSLGSNTLLVVPRLVGGDYPYRSWKTDWDGVVWESALGIAEEVRLLLPEGFSVESMPADVHQDLLFVSAVLSYRVEGRTLVYSRRYARQSCLLKKADYDTLFLFHQKLDEAERRPAIIRRLPVAPSSGSDISPPEKS